MGDHLTISWGFPSDPYLFLVWVPPLPPQYSHRFGWVLVRTNPPMFPPKVRSPCFDLTPKSICLTYAPPRTNKVLQIRLSFSCRSRPKLVLFHPTITVLQSTEDLSKALCLAHSLSLLSLTVDLLCPSSTESSRLPFFLLTSFSREPYPSRRKRDQIHTSFL